MAKTPAQRQAAYRAPRHDGEGTRRLSTWISVPAYFALQRLARHHGTTQREMIERLAIQTDEQILSSLELDTPEWLTAPASCQYPEKTSVASLRPPRPNDRGLGGRMAWNTQHERPSFRSGLG